MHPSLPTGTITFLFTDIEGSTELAQQHVADLPSLLAQHHALLRHAIEANNGQVFQIVGDGFCAAFFTASDALQVALAAQRQLQQAAWHPVALKVRMGIHTGPAQAGGVEGGTRDYTGYLTLARAQRVMSEAYGGQVLISSASAELLRGDLPDGVELRDLGEHRLKGLLNPEHLWQVTAPDLRSEFPPLSSLNTIPNNLPVQLDSFIGRERELTELKRVLATARLVTLTGPGRCGKTRLALQVAIQVAETFAAGACWVGLAPLTDPALVPQTVAHALGVYETPLQPLLHSLSNLLRDKQLLLIFDNCEQLVKACAELVDALLHAAPHLVILATSREALRVAGETTWLVPSLSLPPAQLLLRPGSDSASALLPYDAIRLFDERATSALAAFKMTNENVTAVLQVCQRLDGIPLAIELAAARVNVLSVQQTAKRLDDRFNLLTSGTGCHSHAGIHVPPVRGITDVSR